MEPIPRRELESWAVALGQKIDAVFRLSDHDLKQLLVQNRVPIFRRKHPEEPQADELAQAPEVLPQPVRQPPTLRVFDFLQDAPANFQAGVQALEDQRRRPLPATSWVLPRDRQDQGERVSMLTEQLEEARKLYKSLCVLLGGMEQDGDFSRADFAPYLDWMKRKQHDVELCEQALHEELKECRESIQRREVVNNKCLEFGVIDHGVYESWSKRQLDLRRQLDTLELTLGS